jgi:hypothetical protein
MSRRSTLPGAAELFRATASGGQVDEERSAPPTGDGNRSTLAALPGATAEPAAESVLSGRTGAETGLRGRRRATGERKPSGRERHDEKITVYVSPEELLDLEHARLTLRGEHGLAVDRGRIVREALAVVIADLEAKGDDSIIVRRLVGR